MSVNPREKENIWNIPNLLTMLRMALIFVFFELFFSGKLYPALAVFLIAGATDLLDGYIARKYQLITDFGKLMDPLADKLMTIAVLVALLLRGWVPVWVLATVIAKEVLMLLGGALMLKRGVVVFAAPIGKAATTLFMLAITVTFFHPYTAPVDLLLQGLAVALTLAAMIWYALDAMRQIRQKNETRT